MAKLKDTTAPIGKQFGTRVVIGYSHYNSTSRSTFWNVRCACGRVGAVNAYFLPNTTKCLPCSTRQAQAAKRTHGLTNTPEHNTWESIRQRTSNPKNAGWLDYGGRGIRLCERWLKFGNFIADMGRRPPNTTIDRIDNDGNYSCGTCSECAANGWPMNCRWALPIEQANNKRTNTVLEFKGERHTVAEWSRSTGLDSACIVKRLSRGWPVEKVLTKPPLQRRRAG